MCMRFSLIFSLYFRWHGPRGPMEFPGGRPNDEGRGVQAPGRGEVHEGQEHVREGGGQGHEAPQASIPLAFATLRG